MAVKRKDRKMKTIDEETDSSIRLHTNSCDKLYRWSMWRMHLNEELSRVISSRFDFSDQSKSVNKVTSPYLRHRDGIKYGRHMKKLFQKNLSNSRSLDILPDNVYLVYGLPRVSIHNVPEEVKKLHESVKPCQTYSEQKDTASSECIDAGEQITKMFEFVTSDFTKGDVSQLTFRRLGGNRPRTANGQNGNAQSHDQEHKRTIRRKIALPGDDAADRKGDTEQEMSEIDVPLVSKSRLFWERLANKKTDIIDMKNRNGHVNDANIHAPQYVVPPAPVRSEIKQTQQYVVPPAPVMSEIKQTQHYVVPTAPVRSEIKQTQHYVVPTAPAMSEMKQTQQYIVPPAPVKSEIKETAHYTTMPATIEPETEQTTEVFGISSEILQKQQKLLKKTIPKRTSKDLWRTIRDRKTEILQLREMNGNCERVSSNQGKKHESKTSQLWSFLFTKKRELVQMKQGSKGNHEAIKGHQQQERGKKHHNVSNDNAQSNIIPSNFEDNFQKELAEKLRKRREKYIVIESSNL